MRMLSICCRDGCQGHLFVLIVLDVLPYTVLALCAECGSELMELTDLEELTKEMPK